MSDEEEYSEEEYEESEVEETPEAAKAEETPAAEPEPEAAAEAEEEEEDEAEAPAAAPPARSSIQSEEAPKLRKVERPAHKEPENDADNMTEAERAMREAKARHEAEQEAKAVEADERRRQELQQVEQELIELKERQVQRKAELEQFEKELAERRRQDDERRRQQEEERKEKIEAQKRFKEEEKLKRQQMMAGSFVTSSVGNKRKQRSAEQNAEAKKNYIASIQKPDVSNLLPNDLKVKIKQLYQKILRLEHDKYDLEQRHQRQDYDLKEMTERQSQQARNKALAAGVEVEQLESGSVRPPKVNVASKHDRQKDHRSWGERRDKFENPFEAPELSIAHGSGRPPAEWGKRKVIDEIEVIRKNLADAPKYVENAPVEGDLAKPPVPVIPLQVPSE